MFETPPPSLCPLILGTSSFVLYGTFFFLCFPPSLPFLFSSPPASYVYVRIFFLFIADDTPDYARPIQSNPIQSARNPILPCHPTIYMTD